MPQELGSEEAKLEHVTYNFTPLALLLQTLLRKVNGVGAKQKASVKKRIRTGTWIDGAEESSTTRKRVPGGARAAVSECHLTAAQISMHTEAARTSEHRRTTSTSKLHEDADNEGRRERCAARYVPISHEARYLRCSAVRLSIVIPSVCSFSSATCLSISAGTL